MAPSSTLLNKAAILELRHPLQLTILLIWKSDPLCHLSLGGERLSPFLVMYEGHEVMCDVFVM